MNPPAPYGRSWYRLTVDDRGCPNLIDDDEDTAYPPLDAVLGEDTVETVNIEMGMGHMGPKILERWWLTSGWHPGMRILIEGYPPILTTDGWMDGWMEHNVEFDIAIVKIDHGRWTLERRFNAALGAVRRWERFDKAMAAHLIQMTTRARNKGPLVLQESWFCSVYQDNMMMPDRIRLTLHAYDPESRYGSVVLATAEGGSRQEALTRMDMHPEVARRGLSGNKLRALPRSRRSSKVVDGPPSNL